MIRAFLDTNVLVSAVIFAGGKPDQIVRRASDDFDWLTSEFVIAEVTRVLKRRYIQSKYKAHLTPERQEQFLAELQQGAILVERPEPIRPTSRDIHDDPVLADARAGEANYLVTGDEDLLVLGSFEEIQIVSPSEFLQILEKERK